PQATESVPTVSSVCWFPISPGLLPHSESPHYPFNLHILNNLDILHSLQDLQRIYLLSRKHIPTTHPLRETQPQGVSFCSEVPGGFASEDIWMYTSVALLALSGLFASTAEKPSWLADYGLARALGRATQKPLAVFVGTGQEGWEKLSQDGKLGKEVNQLLAANYVCVYLDTTQATARRLAASFEVSHSVGVIISDRGGDWQAFHHDGNLAGEALARSLRRYADPEHVVQYTESNPVQRTSFYPSGSSAPTARPYAPPIMFQPSFSSRGC